MNTLASLLETIVSEEVSSSECALLFSGGVDSLSCGFAAEALGKKVHAYTFRLDGRANADSISAERAAKLFGWKFTLVDVPTSNLGDDFIKLAEKYDCRKKTQFECTFPFLYLVPKITERFVLSGIAADGHYGLSKKAMIHFRTPKAKFDTFRKDYFGAANPAGQIQQRALLSEYDHIQCAPYLDRRIFDFFLGFNWFELNTPYQKMATLLAYRDRFRIVGRRRHANLQLVAGIDKAFERLLNSRLNIKRRRRVLDLCADFASQK